MTWDREKQLGWPERGPIYTVFSLLLVLALTAFLSWRNITDDLKARTPLQKYYWNLYLSSKLFAPIWPEYKFRMLRVVDEKKRETRWAIDADLTNGETENADGKTIPFALSDWSRQQGSTQLILEPPQTYYTRRLHDTLRQYIYEDRDVPDWFLAGMIPAFWRGFAGLLIGFALAVPVDRKRMLALRYGRRIGGPEPMSAGRFNRRHRSDGIGFVTQENRFDRILERTDKQVHIPRRSESKGLAFIGDTGTGKSSLIRRVLMEVQSRGELAIVYDPACEYLPQFYDPERGDIVLNPLDARCPYWSPGEEVRHFAEAATIAKSIFPSQPGEQPFFEEGKRRVFAHLLQYRPTAQELIEWMCRPEEIDRRVRGTEVERLLAQGAHNQREGILASFVMIADSLRLLPDRKEARTTWTAADWADKRRGWIFLTSLPSYRDALRPLISLWLDLLILRLMDYGNRGTVPVWFVLDEIATLHQLSQLPVAVAENRKTRNPVVLGFQGKGQVEAIYGAEQAETMLSQLATKVFMRTSHPRAAKWISEAIGELEVEKLEESHSYGQHNGKSYRLTHSTRPLVPYSEIEGLPDCKGYLKFGNDVVRLRFPYVRLPELHEAFIRRKFRVEPIQLALPLEAGAEQSPAATPASVSLAVRKPVQPVSQTEEPQRDRFLY